MDMTNFEKLELFSSAVYNMLSLVEGCSVHNRGKHWNDLDSDTSEYIRFLTKSVDQSQETGVRFSEASSSFIRDKQEDYSWVKDDIAENDFAVAYKIVSDLESVLCDLNTELSLDPPETELM